MGFLLLDKVDELNGVPFRMSTIDIVEVDNDACCILLYNDDRALGEFSILVTLRSAKVTSTVLVDQKLEGLAACWDGRNQYLSYSPAGYVFQGNDGQSEDSAICQMGYTLMYGELTRAKSMVGKVYLIGMSRQVYVLERGQGWIHIGDEVLDHSVERLHFSGFLCADGMGSEILFAGIGGEVWRYAGARWEKLDSPYDADIHDMVCVEPGRYFLVGQVGVFGSYVNGRWYDYSNEMPREDIRSIVARGDQLILLSGGRLFAVSMDKSVHVDDVREARIGDSRVRSLASGRGCVWGLTRREIIRVGANRKIQTIDLGNRLAKFGISLD